MLIVSVVEVGSSALMHICTYTHRRMHVCVCAFGWLGD